MQVFGIILSQTDLWLLGICIPFVLALVGFYLTNTLNRKNRFNAAAGEFRDAFTDEIRLIKESTMKTDFTEIFNNGYTRHHNALIRFLPSLSKRDKAKIKKAWDDHCKDYYPDAEKDGFDGPKAITRFMHYEFKQGREYIGNGKFKITEEKYDAFERAKQLASKNLESILSFAKSK